MLFQLYLKNNDIERDVIFNVKFELNGHTHILEGRIDKVINVAG